ncbi:MAG: S-methyl-5-thioribose-1-phosphate isomerase [Candidatus Omnitrophica bacterium]|nr:S-methyl-5-thioribose-1-phosphate isomerase [Candidatus Omnitrophota bacterium]MDE2231414.1 S-methyl-5-thioribose-1-phosphate isomerase [Candidatus Omnitrophota bacterium]
MSVETIKWVNGAARIIDQTKLPHKFEYIYCRDVKTMWQAIKRLSVRGAPAIGVAAAFGVVLGVQKFKGRDKTRFLKLFNATCSYLGTSRPTAVDLFNRLSEMRAVVDLNPQAGVPALKKALQLRAMSIFQADRRVCRQMGGHGVKLIKNGMRCLTICNAGALATVDYGTAQGVFYAARAKGKKFSVYACETRPLLQGARLTCWELMAQKIDTTLICDNMAASLMASSKVDIIFTGADRIASNGDAANKIGTYMLAVLARHHGIPFYVVAPGSSFDLKIKSGRQIPIEERKSDEVTCFAGVSTAPRGVKVYNPAFDVTPAKLITGIVTEYGIIRPPYAKNIHARFANR